jgi:phosphoribosylformimino-5-aminoimidazole carboxamide ribotide isomerase
MAGIDRWLAGGVRRVILGSAAAKNPALVREAARAHPGRVVVGVDARGGFVATECWAETSTLAVHDLAARFEDAGVAAIVYTDIGRDGMLGGLDLDGTRALASHVRIPVIASGGVGGIEDLLSLKRVAAEAGGRIEGVIIGRALYDGRIDLAGALAVLAD